MVLVTHIWGITDLVVLKVILASFSMFSVIFPKWTVTPK